MCSRRKEDKQRVALPSRQPHHPHTFCAERLQFEVLQVKTAEEGAEEEEEEEEQVGNGSGDDDGDEGGD